MSPRQQNFLFLALGLFAGALGGSYFSARGAHEPAPINPPAQCPPCSPPITTRPIEPSRPIPTSTTGIPRPDIEPQPPIPEPEPSRLPGLPSQAIKIAGDAFRREVAECLAEASKRGIEGSAVLDLTVTATSGLGHIREVGVGAITGNARDLDACIRGAAHRVEFRWASGEGESKLRYPVRFVK